MRSMKLQLVSLGLESVDAPPPVDVNQCLLNTEYAVGNEELADARLRLTELQHMAQQQAEQIRAGIETLLSLEDDNYQYGLEALDIPANSVSGVESARATILGKIKPLITAFKHTLAKLREVGRDVLVAFRNLFLTHKRVYDHVQRKYNRNPFCRTLDLPHVVGSVFRQSDSEYITNLSRQSMECLEDYSVRYLAALDQTRDAVFDTFDSLARATRYEQLPSIYKKIGAVRLPVINGMKAVGDYRESKRYRDNDRSGNMFGLDLTQYLRQNQSKSGGEEQLIAAIFAYEHSRVVIEQGSWNHIAQLNNDNVAAWMGVTTQLMAWHDRFNPHYDNFITLYDEEGQPYSVHYADTVLERIFNSPVNMSNQQLTLVLDYVREATHYLDSAYMRTLSQVGCAAQRFLGALLTTLDKGLKG